MPSVNKVIIIGNLGRDPETRYSPSGDAVTNISVATTYKPKEGEEKTEWHRIVFFKRLAEIAGEYLVKGAPVYVEGYLETKKWQDKEGVDRYTTQIIAQNMQLLGSRPQGQEQSGHREQPRDQQRGGEQRGSAKPAAKKPAGKFDDMEDDIPF